MVYKLIGYLALVAIYYFLRVHVNGVVIVVVISGLVARVVLERNKTNQEVQVTIRSDDDCYAGLGRNRSRGIGACGE